MKQKDTKAQRMRYLLLFILFFAAIGLQAQELTVKSLGVAEGDLDARSDKTRRQDKSGNFCALLKVQLPLQGAQFDGVVGDVQFRAGVYWVYLPNGGYLLKISHPQFHMLDLNLRNLWKGEDRFYGVEQLTTYNLIINVPQSSEVVQLDDGLQRLVMHVNPKNSKVVIDGKKEYVPKDGQLHIILSKGRHRYHVEAEGYSNKEGTMTLGDREETVDVTLQPIRQTINETHEQTAQQAVNTVSAQALTVKRFEPAYYDLDAAIFSNERKDNNGMYCALLKVQLPLQGVVFVGAVGSVEFKAGEYWVYMAEGSYQLGIRHPQFQKLDIDLRQLCPKSEHFEGVKQRKTYNLVINVPQAKEFTVKSFELTESDLDAINLRRTDLNGRPCALVKVHLPIQGVVINGMVIGDVEYRDGIYWVYMADGSHKMSILHPQFYRLDIELRQLRPANEGFSGVKQLHTYKLIIDTSQSSSSR